MHLTYPTKMISLLEHLSKLYYSRVTYVTVIYFLRISSFVLIFLHIKVQLIDMKMYGIDY